MKWSTALNFLAATQLVFATKNDLRRKKLLDESDRFLAPNEGGMTRRFLVKFNSTESLIRSQSAMSNSGRSSSILMTMEEFDMEVVDISSEEELEELMANDEVVFFEPDQERYLLHPVQEPTGTGIRNRRRQQESETVPYGIDLVRALEVSDEFVEGIKVCIIDTGYDISHEDLPKGSNVGGNDNGRNPWDEDGNGHGTHVAGTIAAIGDNDVGVVGVNRNGKIGLHIERIFGDNGRPIFGSTLIGVANKCVAAGSNIISMSLGGPVRMQSESEAFERIYKENNVLVVAAAGNSANKAYSYPASYDSVMSVAAVDKDSKVAYFSQQNDQVDISAPGVQVESTKTGGGYVAYSGTSMACPHVAGVAALVWSHFLDDDLTSEEIRYALTATADDLGPDGRDDSYGYGLVRADRAFQFLNGEITLSPTVAPTPQRPCFDDPQDFIDSRENGCDWYEESSWINRCRWFGPNRGNDDGTTANEACCICGGGGFSPIEKTPSPSAAPTVTSKPSFSPTDTPTATPSSSPTECTDEEGWVNSFGRNCEWYGAFRCWLWGNSFENEDGLTANDACCVCQ